jgi:hypothetical protein
MADSRDILGKNRKFKGTAGVVVPKGSTAERVDTESGELRFNTTTELMEYYDGVQWKPIDAPPTISSISTDDALGDAAVLAADGSTLYTITITGGNFGIGVTVKFIGNTGTEYTAGSITRVSNSSITCTTTVEMGTADDPYDVQVANVSGLAATLEDAFSFNAPPVFTNASGSLGEVWNGRVVSGTTLNAGATDAEGNEITFSIVSGTLPGSGLSISSSTGAITGTLSGTPSLGNYPFTVRAATAEGIVDRAFSIDVIAFPGVVATGGTITDTGDYKIHTFTGPGTFTVTSAGSPLGSDSVDYLVVAGGGSAGGYERTGGAGAGGFRESVPSPAAWTASPLANSGGSLPVSVQGYPVVVGGGGPGTYGPGSAATRGTNGSNSSFSTITSAGGGGAGGGQPGSNTPEHPGLSGGSGGGGGSGSSVVFPGGAGNTPPVAPPQGGAGGTGAGGANQSGAGGGGATSAGTNGPEVSVEGNGGPGGTGAGTAINPSPSVGTPGPSAPLRYFSGGGGGGAGPSGPLGGTGGYGGGGSCGAHPTNGTPGTTNTGGGAGGSGGAGTAANGGSGIVIIRYKYK